MSQRGDHERGIYKRVSGKVFRTGVRWWRKRIPRTSGEPGCCRVVQ